MSSCSLRAATVWEISYKCLAHFLNLNLEKHLNPFFRTSHLSEVLCWSIKYNLNIIHKGLWLSRDKQGKSPIFRGVVFHDELEGQLGSHHEDDCMIQLLSAGWSVGMTLHPSCSALILAAAASLRIGGQHSVMSRITKGDS